MKTLTLFSNIGIDECYLHELGIDVVVANELEEDRCEFYRKLYPSVNMIQGTITESDVYDKVINAAKGVEMIIATPPCQGMSIAHAKRANKNDPRNSLIKYVVKAINDLEPKHVLIENVREMAKTFIQHEGEAVNIMEFIRDNISSDYNITYKVLDAANYNTPQHRKRLIVLISKEGVWEHPQPNEKLITVRETIGHLPSLESGESSDITWHSSKQHNENHVLWMRHTPTGKSAFDNDVYFPSVKCEQLPGTPKKNSFNIEFNKPSDKKIKAAKPIPMRCIYFPDKNEFRREIAGFKSTYKRMDWDKPAPAITMQNGSINSQNNVHPGKLNKDKTYSDARTLTIRELLILCGLPDDWFDKHTDMNENFLRNVIGECFPPKMCLEIMKTNPSIKKKP